MVATTTALSGSGSSESDDGDSSSGGSAQDQVDISNELHPATVPGSHSRGEIEQHVAAPAPSTQTRRITQRHTLGARGRSSSSSSSDSENEDAAACAAGNNQLTRGVTVARPISRSNEAREARLKLPIVAEEQPLMDLVHHSTCVVLQVPSALIISSLTPVHNVTNALCDAG